MAHRSRESELVGRVFSQQVPRAPKQYKHKVLQPADTYNPQENAMSNVKGEIPTSVDTYSQRKKDDNLMGESSGDTNVGRGSKNHLKDYQQDNHADTYNPNHPQIVRFYKKWGKNGM